MVGVDGSLDGGIVMDAWVAIVFILGFFIGLGLVIFLVITKAFRAMGLSAAEAVVIVVGSFVCGAGVLDEALGIPLSNLPVASVGLWQIGVNLGGAVIPVLVSVYLIVRRHLPAGPVVIGVIIVSVAAFVVSTPDPAQGIVSRFPWWLVPVVAASMCSVALPGVPRRKAAACAYVVGACGVLIGADLAHLLTLVSNPISTMRSAVIGGASVFDMVFTTGLLAVLIDIVLGVSGSKKQDAVA